MRLRIRKRWFRVPSKLDYRRQNGRIGIRLDNNLRLLGPTWAYPKLETIPIFGGTGSPSWEAVVETGPVVEHCETNTLAVGASALRVSMRLSHDDSVSGYHLVLPSNGFQTGVFSLPRLGHLLGFLSVQVRISRNKDYADSGWPGVRRT